MPMNFLCIGESGWRLFVKASQKRKDELSENGPLIKPHKSAYVFSRSNCTINLYQLHRALLHANIQQVKIAAYGMKTPVSEVISIDAAKCTGLFRYDIGHNVDACNIPVFCADEGATYPMFGEIFGSICMKINVANENVQSVTLKCYPQVIKTHGSVSCGPRSRRVTP